MHKQILLNRGHGTPNQLHTNDTDGHPARFLKGSRHNLKARYKSFPLSHFERLNPEPLSCVEAPKPQESDKKNVPWQCNKKKK